MSVNKNTDQKSEDIKSLDSYKNVSDKVLILSERDKAGFDYLVRIRGKEAVELAVDHLAGKRRPYVSNVAKLMMVTIPTSLQREELPASDDMAKKYLAQMRKILSGGMEKND